MRSALSALLSLFVGLGVLLAGNTLLGTAVAVEMEAVTRSSVRTGLVMSAYFVGFGLATLQVDRLVVRVGHIRTFAAFAALVGASGLAHALSPPWTSLWTPLRLGTGFAMGGLFVVAESWLHSWSAPETRGRLLGAYMLLVYLAMAGGQGLFAFDLPAGERFVLAACLVSLAVVPVALTRTAAPEIHHRAVVPLRDLVRAAPLGVAGAVASGLLAASLLGMGPVYASTSAFAAGGVAAFMAAAILGGLIFQIPAGRLSDLTDRRRMLVGVALLAPAVALALGILGPTGRVPSLLLAALYGAAALSLYPLALAHVFDKIPGHQVLAAGGTVLGLNAAGAACGPLLCSLVMSLAGGVGFLWFGGGVGLLLAGYGALRLAGHDPVPIEDQEPFVAVPRTSTALAELDPRSEEEDEAEAPGGASPGAPTPTSRPLAAAPVDGGDSG